MTGRDKNEVIIPSNEEIEEVIKMLDSKTQEGRCDVGSPFADGSVGNFGCD